MQSPNNTGNPPQPQQLLEEHQEQEKKHYFPRWVSGEPCFSSSKPAFPATRSDVEEQRKIDLGDPQTHALPSHYELTKADVNFGRGRRACKNIGNRRFRVLASLNLKRYFEADSKADKSIVVAGICSMMRQACPSGGFLKRQEAKARGNTNKTTTDEEDRWVSVGGKTTREKMGHCLRDMIASFRDGDERKREWYRLLQLNYVSTNPVQETSNSKKGNKNNWVEYTSPLTRIYSIKAPEDGMTGQQKAILKLLECGYEGRTTDLCNETKEY